MAIDSVTSLHPMYIRRRWVQRVSISFSLAEPASRLVQPFCTAHQCAQHAESQTAQRAASVATGRIYAMHRRRLFMCCILASGGSSFFVDFPNKKCNFLHKTSLISYGGSNSSEGGALRWVFLLVQSPPLPYGSRRLWLRPSNIARYLCSMQPIAETDTATVATMI